MTFMQFHKAKEKRRTGTIISVLAHLLLLLFIIADPPLHTDPNLKELQLGAGGPGPAGGGGGGNAGTGVRFITIAPPPQPVVVPPVTPPPVIVPPKPPEPVVPIDLPKLALPDTKVEIKIQSPVIGIGGGTGHDGTTGNGPGSGGGVGAGVGPGRGSGVGPGTGGGDKDVYPPTSKEMLIPPLPAPKSVKCFHLIANYDVDEKGKVLGMKFTPTKDGGYNRKLEDVLNGVKWKPGTTMDGTPIRATAQLTYDFGC